MSAAAVAGEHPRRMPAVRTTLASGAALLLNITLLALIAYTLAQGTWRLLTKPAAEMIRPAGSVGQVRAETVAGPDVAVIVNAHLFGKSAVVTPTPSLYMDAPVTPLDLVLKGILFAENPDDSRAIISANKGPHIPYAIGAEISGGARLEAMFSDRVILSRNGRFETLLLTRKPADAGSASPSAQLAPQGQPSIYSVDNSGNRDISELLGNFRQTLMQNPQEVAAMVQVEPVKDGEQFVGFRLRSDQNHQFLQKVGLASGDVVTSVNGIQIDSPMKGIEVMKELSSAQDISLSVVRNGNVIALRYRVAESGEKQ